MKTRRRRICTSHHMHGESPSETLASTERNSSRSRAPASWRLIRNISHMIEPTFDPVKKGRKSPLIGYGWRKAPTVDSHKSARRIIAQQKKTKNFGARY